MADDKQEVLELYKVLVGTVTANEQRRQQINSVFLSLIGIGAAGLGAFYQSEKPVELLFIAVPGMFLSAIWWAQISYLRRLASAKFRVIETMESQFVMKPFTDEWSILSAASRKARLSEIEGIVPQVCFALCLLYTAYRIIPIAP
ncbi:MAG: hypothetical protein ACFB03_23625 [Paracoccaceae bacterium]